MKKSIIFLFVCLLPVIAFCQSDLIKLQKDQFTKESKYTTDVQQYMDSVNAKVVLWQISKIDTKVIFNVSGIQEGFNSCSDINNPITFLFDDNSTMIIRNGRSFSCDGWMGTTINKKHVASLSSNTIKAIRLNYRGSNFDINIPAYVADLIKNEMNAIQEAKF